MKKTVSINLSGFAYEIDEDAWVTLQDYTAALKAELADHPRADELMQLFERRAAQLANTELLGNETISQEMLKRILAQLGEPEDVATTTPGSTLNTDQSCKNQGTGRWRRMYRNTDARWIAGVCAGIGAYFVVDQLVIRFIFVILTLVKFIGVPLYIVLWAILPRAVTPEQKREMNGKPLSMRRLKEAFTRKHQNTIPAENYEATNVNNYATTKYTSASEPSPPNEDISKTNRPQQQEKTAFKARRARVANGVQCGLQLFFKAFALLLGTALLLTMLYMFAVLISSLIYKILQPSFLEPFINCHQFNQFVASMFGVVSGAMVTTALFLALMLPVLVLIYCGIRILVKIKTPNVLLASASAMVWMMAVVVLAFNVFAQWRSLSIRETRELNIALDSVSTSNKVIYVDILSDTLGYSDIRSKGYNFCGYQQVTLDGEPQLVAQPTLVIDRTQDPKPLLQIAKNARGANHFNAGNNAENIEYQYLIKDSTLKLSPCFVLPSKLLWKGQNVNVKLCLPIDYAIHLNEAIGSIMATEQPLSKHWANEMLNKTWIMTENGLSEAK